LIYAINALEKLLQSYPSFIFFVIGEGEQRGHLEELIKQKKLENHVMLLGYVAHAAEYLRGLNLFLLPSVKEGLPYCLIEAGYAGIPVIATTVGGIPELINDMESGILIQPKKSDEISHAIEFLIEHKKTEREYARNFQERVKSMFNLDQMIQPLYKSIPNHREEKLNSNKFILLSNLCEYARVRPHAHENS
jgi:glycosyltransferase involved in cell wall biosynthesis